VDDDTSEALTNFLWEQGALGVVEEQAAGERPILRAFFPDVLPPAALRSRVSAYLTSLNALGLGTAAAPTLVALADRDWGEAWREHFRPLPVGRRLCVAPPWDVPPGADRLVLIIEPGRAFGTGHHGSTAGCLDLLERTLEMARVEAALDLGTGSGILAVAAVKLGVPRVVAVDEDPDAVAAAAANAERNGVAARIDCRLGDAATSDLGPAPLVLANLLTAAHLKLGQRYRRLVVAGGTLVLGGILDAEADLVRDAVAGHGLAPSETRSIDGWSALGFRAPIHDRA
jgi:ribosomal protein L11 methyltransferase